MGEYGGIRLCLWLYIDVGDGGATIKYEGKV